MQTIISGNTKSRTEQIMVSSGEVIPFYSAPKSMPELGIQFQKISPYITFNGTAANNSMTWKLPPGSGFLYEGSIGITATCTVVTADLATPFGLNCVRLLEWIANGQPIVSMTGYALKAIVKTLPIPEQEFIYRYAMPLDPGGVGAENIAANGDTTILFYIPLITTFLSETQKCLLLNATGDLQLRLTFATQAEAGLTNPIDSVSSSELFLQTYMPKLSVYNEMVQNDWSKQLVMEMFNTYTEVGTLKDFTTASYTITCPYLVYRTHLFVQNISGIVGSPFYNITNLSMNLGGIQFIDNYKKSRLLSRKSRSGVGSRIVTDGTNVLQDNKSIVTIDWGVESTRHKNTGTVFFQELRGTNVSVTFDPVGTITADLSKAQLFVVHEYFQAVSFTPGSGGGSGSLQIFSNN